MPTIEKSAAPRKLGRRFGLEFEHISKWNVSDLRRELERQAVPLDSTNSSSYHEYLGWQIKQDGSITPQPKYPYGIELVTPPSSAHDYTTIKRVLSIAKTKGAVNSSCGLHVHVHAPELASVLATYPNREWQHYISEAWLAIEKVMFSYMPPSRRMSHYCRPGIQWTTKYQAINFSPLHDDRHTVEFRPHNSTLNPIKAMAFAMLCRGVVEAMVRHAKFNKLNPTAREHTKPSLIRTPRGGEFYLQRDKSGKWLIEAKKLTVEMPELPLAFKELRKELKLNGKHYLEAFHYPHYGNAMTELCELAQVNGMFRGYIEDRYDRMLKKYGAADAKTQQQRLLPDEGDFYHEPDYDPNDQLALESEVQLDDVNEEDDGDDREDDHDPEYGEVAHSFSPRFSNTPAPVPTPRQVREQAQRVDWSTISTSAPRRR